MSQLTRDEGVALLLEQHKLASYGFLMLVLEAICERMEPLDTVTSARYSKAEWARLTRTNTKNVDKYMQQLPNVQWIEVTLNDGFYTVDAPKLLKWRDEYSRKSGSSQDPVRRKSHREERDQIKSEKEENSSFDDIKRRVLVALDSKIAAPNDFHSVSRMAGVSPKQAKAAIAQLRGDGQIGGGRP